MEEEIIIEDKEGIIVQDLIGEYTVLTKRKDHPYLGIPQYFCNVFFKDKPILQEKLNVNLELAILQHENFKSTVLEATSHSTI